MLHRALSSFLGNVLPTEAHRELAATFLQIPSKPCRSSIDCFHPWLLTTSLLHIYQLSFKTGWMPFLCDSLILLFLLFWNVPRKESGIEKNKKKNWESPKEPNPIQQSFFTYLQHSILCHKQKQGGKKIFACCSINSLTVLTLLRAPTVPWKVPQQGMICTVGEEPT